MNFNGKGRALAYASSRNDYHAHKNRYCSSVGDVAWRARGGATPDHWMGMKHAPSRQFTPLANLKLQHMSHAPCLLPEHGGYLTMAERTW